MENKTHALNIFRLNKVKFRRAVLTSELFEAISPKRVTLCINCSPRLRLEELKLLSITKQEKLTENAEIGLHPDHAAL